MATKTLVCPECGAESTPGRYACVSCGAFLDGIAVAPRTWAAGDPTASAVAPIPVPSGPDDEGVSTGDLGPDASEPEGSPPAGDADLTSEPAEVPEPTWPDPVATPRRAAFRAEPDVLRGVDDASRRDRDDEPVPPASSGPVWPPSGVGAALPAPEPRTPAGAWLPPSAVLPTADELAEAKSVTTSERRDWLGSLLPNDERWAVSRRAVAIGAAVAIVGFVLPWATAPFDVLVANWLRIWGLAGAGHWLAVLAVAAVGLAAAGSGRSVSWRVGLPAVALGAFVLGLTWPTLAGAAARPFGVLVAFAGALVLLAGGVLGAGARHEAETPAV